MSMTRAEAEEETQPSFIVLLLSFPPPAHTHPCQGKERKSSLRCNRNVHPFGNKAMAPDPPAEPE